LSCYLDLLVRLFVSRVQFRFSYGGVRVRTSSPAKPVFKGHPNINNLSRSATLQKVNFQFLMNSFFVIANDKFANKASQFARRLSRQVDQIRQEDLTKEVFKRQFREFVGSHL
jgi:hypothetical protein